MMIALASVTMLLAGATGCDAKQQRQGQQAALAETSQNTPATARPQTAEPQDSVYTQVDKQPQFPGGMDKMYAFLAQHLKYPEKAIKDKVSGKVVVSFVVETDGSLTGIKVEESVHPALDAESVRVVKSMPKWEPGTKDGKAVRTKTTFPIAFRLK